MTQKKFDLAENLVYNSKEIEKLLVSEVNSIIETENWFVNNNLGLYFQQALSDFIVYKIKWMILDEVGDNYESIDEIVTPAFIVDLFGEQFLNIEYWRNRK